MLAAESVTNRAGQSLGALFWLFSDQKQTESETYEINPSSAPCSFSILDGNEGALGELARELGLMGAWECGINKRDMAIKPSFKHEKTKRWQWNVNIHKRWCLQWSQEQVGRLTRLAAALKDQPRKFELLSFLRAETTSEKRNLINSINFLSGSLSFKNLLASLNKQFKAHNHTHCTSFNLSI